MDVGSESILLNLPQFMVVPLGSSPYLWHLHLSEAPLLWIFFKDFGNSTWDIKNLSLSSNLQNLRLAENFTKNTCTFQPQNG